jgi:hypothetical protein
LPLVQIELIHALRRLQLSGALTVRFQHDDSGNRVFDPKFASGVVQNLIVLAETGQNSKAPLVTIPAYSRVRPSSRARTTAVTVRKS